MGFQHKINDLLHCNHRSTTWKAGPIPLRPAENIPCTCRAGQHWSHWTVPEVGRKHGHFLKGALGIVEFQVSTQYSQTVEGQSPSDARQQK